MRLLHSFCGRNKKKKTCIALQANECTASWLNKIHVKLLGTKKKMQKKLLDPTPYSCVVLITSGLSHAILVLLNGFGAVNCCMGPALPLQIKLTVVSPLLLFLATITLIL